MDLFASLLLKTDHMKRILLIIALLAFCNIKIYASHAYGASIAVVKTALPDEYLLRLHFYRDCSGIAALPSVDVCYVSTTLAVMNSINLSFISSNVITNTACYPQLGFNCANGLGAEEYIYEGLVMLPPAEDWWFSYSECCRSSSVTNVTNGSSYEIQVEATLDNLSFPDNSTPDFTSIITPFVCINVPIILNNSVTEPDGDSIVYSLVNALSGTCGSLPVPMPYSNPYSFSDFTSSSVPIVIDASNGDVLLTPASAMASIMVVKATEYRNGMESGSTMRDIIVFSVVGTSNPNAVEGTVYFDANSDSIIDAADLALQGIQVASPSTGSSMLTNVNGEYKLFEGTNNQTVSLSSVPLNFTALPAYYNYNFTGSGQLMTNSDFLLTAAFPFNNMSITVTGVTPLRPGETSVYLVDCRSLGSVNSTAGITIILDSLQSYYSSNIPPDSIHGDSLFFHVSTISALNHTVISLQLETSASAQPGNYLSTQAVISSANDLDPDDDLYIYTAEVVSSYDPNGKAAFPIYMTIQEVNNGKRIIYTINFQNTGTAPALEVVLKDKLSADLDIGTLQLIASSHPVTMTTEDFDSLKFRFQPIYLPYSGLNEPASHGYVVFSIKPKPGLLANTSIINKADIYFDNNSPIITNSAITYIVAPAAIEENDTKSFIFIYPVPASDIINIKSPEMKNARLEIYNITGERVNERNFNGSGTVDISLLKQGVYTVRCSNEKSSITARFVKQ